MTQQQAIDRCKVLNATKYRSSSIKVKPYRLGPDWYTVCGCGKEDLPVDHQMDTLRSLRSSDR